MQSTESISCVIPTYNAASTLERAVTSVQEQTIGVEQIVIVDDGSSDATLAVAGALQEIDSRIVVETLATNLGPATARNVGWEISRSDWIAFLDADDVWHPQKIELQSRVAAISSDLSILGHRMKAPGEVEQVHQYTLTDLDLTGLITRVTAKQVLRRNPWSTPTVMVRRTIPQRFNPSLRRSEDWDLWIRVLQGGLNGCRLDLPLANMFKARYGVDGLSGNLWLMELGVLDMLSQLRQDGNISPLWHYYLAGASLIKHARRTAISSIQHRTSSGRRPSRDGWQPSPRRGQCS